MLARATPCSGISANLTRLASSRRSRYLVRMSLQFAYRFTQEPSQSSFRDLDSVVLTSAVVTDDGDTITAGTEGTIVGVHGDGESYVVEFSEPNGALATVEPHALKAVEDQPA